MGFWLPLPPSPDFVCVCLQCLTILECQNTQEDHHHLLLLLVVGDGDAIVSASPSATTVVAIRSKRILLLSGV